MLESVADDNLAVKGSHREAKTGWVQIMRVLEQDDVECLVCCVISKVSGFAVLQMIDCVYHTSETRHSISECLSLWLNPLEETQSEQFTV